ncbi:MAG: hypothetical protein R3F59_33690 [Myxococcota bacterium]
MTALLWLALAAAAHPVGERAAAQSSVLTVHRGSVDVDFFADVPDLLVRTARPGSDDVDEVTRAMAVELGTGLLLLVDGEVASMQLREPTPTPERSSEHTMGFALRLRAPLPPEPHTIELVTSNLLEAQNFFAGDVRLDPGLVATDASLLGWRDGRVVRDDTLRWTRGEERRRLSVTLARPQPRWWPALAGLGREPRRVGTALAAQPRDLLRAANVTPGTFAVAVALATALGALGAVRRSSGWVPLVGVALAAVARPALVEGSAAVAIVAAVVAGRRLGDAPAVVAAAGLAAAVHAPGAAAGVVLGWALGRLAGPQRPRSAVVPALAVAALLGLRAAL